MFRAGTSGERGYPPLRLSDSPSILLCSFDVLPAPTGSSRRMTEYVKGLSDRFQVVVLTSKTPDHPHIERFHGARLLRVPVGNGDLASRLKAFDRAVQRQLESEEYALVHFCDPFGGYSICELKSEYPYRLVYEAHGFPSQELRFTHPQAEGDRRFLAKVRRQELFCLMNAHRVVCGSEVTRDFIQGLGVPRENVRVIRAPVDLTPYAPEAMGVPDGSPMRVIYLGSQASYQGLPTLLRAMQQAARRADIRLAIVGPRHPDWQPHLEDLVAELKLAGKVEFQPPVAHDDLYKVLAAADVGVVPLDDTDRNRTQGGALAKASEYFAAGRPVIAADLPVTRELLPDTATLFYPPGDWKALGERLTQLSESPKLRLEMGARARGVASDRADASAIRGMLLDLYDQLLGSSAPRNGAVREAADGDVGTPTSRVKGADHVSDEPVPKTDPAMRRPDDPAEPSARTNPEAALPLGLGAPAQAPATEVPVIVGEQIKGGGGRSVLSTEPDAVAPAEVPMVMGLPLRDASADPTPRPTAAITEPGVAPIGSDDGEARTPSPSSVTLPDPSNATTLPGVVDSRGEFTPIRPIGRPPAAVLAHTPAPPVLKPASPAQTLPDPPAAEAAAPGTAAQVAFSEISRRTDSMWDAVSGTDAASMLAALPPSPASPGSSGSPDTPITPAPAWAPPRLEPTPPLGTMTAPPARRVEPAAGPARSPPVLAPREGAGSAPSDEPEEISSDEVQEADDGVPMDAADLIEPEEPASTLDDDAAPSKLDPWFAQLAHGYCPPEGAQFARHTPPTNFPGRDTLPPDARAKS